MGERAPVALLDAAASARLAVAEAITNIASAPIARLVATSSCRPTGWRAAGHPGEDARLYDAVRAVGRGALPGARHRDPGRQGLDVDADRLERRRAGAQAVTAPLSLIVSAFAPVTDVRRALTPELRARRGEHRAPARRSRRAASNRLGGSAPGPGLRPARGDAAGPRRAGAAGGACSRRCRQLNAAGLLAAYHDVATAACSSRLLRDGVRRAASGSTSISRARRDDRWRRCSPRSWARCWQVRAADLDAVRGRLRAPRPGATACTRIGAPRAGEARSRFRRGAARCSTSARSVLRARLVGDHARDAGAARRSGLRRRGAGARVDATDPGLSATLTLRRRRRTSRRRAVARTAPAARRHPARAGGERPDRDGGRVRPRRLRGGRRPHERPARAAARSRRASGAWPPAAGSRTATCSAPARAGRSRSCSTRARATPSRRSSPAPDTFALGVCNGCQMMSALKEIIPGADALAAVRAQPLRAVRGAAWRWSRSSRARRFCCAGMVGSRMPIAVAHGEGRAEWPSDDGRAALEGGRAGRRPLRRSPRPARPSATPRTRTAPPAASPRSPRPTAA